MRAEFMKPVFPSKTFPNHFTIVTVSGRMLEPLPSSLLLSSYAQGLYPESHGIVDNYFFDRKLHESFSLGGASQNDPKWWLGEPVSGYNTVNS